MSRRASGPTLALLPDGRTPCIEELLPHRGAMLLISRVVEADAVRAVTESVVREDWPLALSGRVSPLALIEVAAQSAGVCGGWDRLLSPETGSCFRGWLVGIKKADFLVEYLRIGDVLRTHVETTLNFGGLRETNCSISWNGRAVGHFVLQLYKADE